MDKNRRNKKYSNWNNQKNNNNQQNQKNQEPKKNLQFNHTFYEDEKARKERQRVIQEIKAREVICPKCGQEILDVASPRADKQRPDKGVDSKRSDCIRQEFLIFVLTYMFCIRREEWETEKRKLTA